MPARRRITPFTTALALALALGLASFAGPAGATTKGSQPAPKARADAPAGNNGTIKIDDYVRKGGVRNRPHVDCGLSVSFFGYDAGTQSATITLTPWAPTAGGAPLRLTTSWTTATRTGGNQFDKNVPISGEQVARAFRGVPAAKQGFHARIDVTVTGSQGADGKHKMVWISPCAPPAPTTTTTSVTSTTRTGGDVAGATAAGPGGSAGGSATPPRSHPAAAPAGEVLGAAASVLSGVGVAAGEPATALHLASTTTG